MRDRLIELLGKELMDYASWQTEMALAGNYDMPSVEEVIADKILKDGWFKPPCKVGDTVYQICFGKLTEQKIIKQSKVTAIKITDKLTITLDYTTNLYDTDIGYWLFIGENAREEAEQALKGGAE